MQKKILIFIPILAIAIVVVSVLVLPVRFTLKSASPSGNSQVRGLSFLGQGANAMDGTLRLIVSHNQTEFRQQTSIPWGRDIKIKWNEVEPVETFVVEKAGRNIVEFQIDGSILRCTKGTEYLANDPYDKNLQHKPTESSR